MRAVLVALVCALVLLTAMRPAAAQGFNMAGGGDTPIQIYADNGIEWASQSSRVIARGNAKAVRGDMTVTADTLTAYYRQGPGGSNEIWRIDADGNVTISNPTDTATGYKGIYDLDKAIFILHGTPARLVTPTETFTADDTLEYWELQHMAVLRGNAVAIQKEKKLQGDVLTAHFKERDDSTGTNGGGKGASGAKAGAKEAPAKKTAAPASGDQGNLDLQYTDAYGHVILTTETEVVTGDRGHYDVDTGIATISGAVKIVRQGNELNGGYAHVNLNTGISTLFGNPPGDVPDSRRVTGTFVPQKKDMDQQRAVFRGTAPTHPDSASDAGEGAK
ncbi:MAG: hypothetical protein M0006_10870 [Magnetospirillum sp.]|nr:hypothetical protein [Magnetospirillum sp.]